MDFEFIHFCLFLVFVLLVITNVFLLIKYFEISNDIETIKYQLKYKEASKESSTGAFYKEAELNTPKVQILPVKKSAQYNETPIKIAEFADCHKSGGNNALKSDKKECESSNVANSLEKNIGSKLFVWLGGLAMIFAGFFLIKYSIEQGLFTPKMRIIAAGFFAAGLCTGAICVKHLLENLKIASILMGAGFAVVYADAYAASEIYSITTKTVSLCIMAASSIALLFVAKRYDKSLNLLAIIGVFLAPFIIPAQHPNSPMLLTYLAFSSIVFIREFKKQNLVFAPILGLVSNLLWSFIWVLKLFSEPSLIWIFAIYEAILCVLFFNFSKHIKAQNLSLINFKTDEEILDTNMLSKLFKQFLSFAVSIIFIFCLINLNRFLNAKGDFRFAYLPTYVFCFVCIFINSQKSGVGVFKVLTTLIFSFSLAFTFRFYSLINIAIPLLFIAAFELFCINKNPNCKSNLISFFISSLIGFLALFIDYQNALFIVALLPLLFLSLKDFDSSKLAQITLTITPSLAFALIAISLDYPYIAVLFSILFIAFLRIRYVQVLAFASSFFAFLGAWIFAINSPKILSLLTFQNSGFKIPETIPLFQCSLFLALIIFSRFFIEKLFKDKVVFKSSFSVATILSAVVAVFYIVFVFMQKTKFANDYTSFCASSLTALAIMAAASFIFKNRDTFAHKFSLILCLIFGLKLCAQPLLLLNPFNQEIYVSGLPILNDFALLLLAPALIFATLANFIKNTDYFWDKIKIAFFCLSVALGFFYINSQIQFCFEGHFVNLAASRTEIHTFSIAWILYALSLLIAGFKAGSKSLRSASFAIMLMAVVKVFLVDGSKLDGLARVLSFAILGICLIGISYLYMKFALNDKKNQ